jgi:hypothetical protein
MSKGNTFESEILENILNNVTIANIGDATGLRGSSTAGNLYAALHTADPGEAGDQTTNEVAYTSYARVAVERNATTKKWTVSSGSATNVDKITWPTATGGSATATHFSIGVAASGASKILYSGALGTSRSISTGITPEAAAGGITITED